VFRGTDDDLAGAEEASRRAHLASKIRDEFKGVLNLPQQQQKQDTSGQAASRGPAPASIAAAGLATQAREASARDKKSEIEAMIDSMPESHEERASADQSKVLALARRVADERGGALTVPAAGGGEREYTPSAAIARRLPSRWPRPKWHAPWKLYRVISGHLGWVRSVAFDPSNEWFATGAGDRTIKIWDTASGQLKLTLTGHIEQVTGLAVSSRHPYLFSVGLDKTVRCWDLEYNRVIRYYHGHLSGVYSVALHPALDVLFTGGRDATCRMWDMRTKLQVHCLSGHDSTVGTILSQVPDPQCVTGSQDSTIRLWDIRTGKATTTLTFHKKGVRALAAHPQEFTFVSGAADNIKKFGFPEGRFLHNFLQHPRSVINAVGVNEDGVAVAACDNGALAFYDWDSGNCFQEALTQAQPGSVESERGIFALAFDATGSRLVTCEADKTVKMWKEDPDATPETHPIQFDPQVVASQMRRF